MDRMLENYRRLSALNIYDLPIECDNSEPACDYCGKKACPGDCQDALDAAADDDFDEAGGWR